MPRQGWAHLLNLLISQMGKVKLKHVPQLTRKGSVVKEQGHPVAQVCYLLAQSSLGPFINVVFFS